MLKAKVFVSLKSGVADPQGNAVKSSLHALGYGEVEEVRVGKYVELILHSDHRSEAERQVRAMCDSLLANPVIEDYHYTLEETPE